MSKKTLGVVVDVKKDYASVQVTTIKPHRIYRKRIPTTKSFLVDISTHSVSTGDKVFFVDCPPKSKKIKWKICSSEDR